MHRAVKPLGEDVQLDWHAGKEQALGIVDGRFQPTVSTNCPMLGVSRRSSSTGMPGNWKQTGGARPSRERSASAAARAPPAE